MKFNPRLKQDIEKFKDYVILVEGNKDAATLKYLGFDKVFAVHQTSVPIRNRIEQIISHLDKKDKVCILTDLDKKGKKLYMLIKSLLQEHNVKVDSSLRGLLLKANLSHIEDITKFMKQIEQI